jgi:hypothetical protein
MAQSRKSHRHTFQKVPPKDRGWSFSYWLPPEALPSYLSVLVRFFITVTKYLRKET